MGVDFFCDQQEFSCSYDKWNNIRITIMNATFNYIKDEINNIVSILNNDTCNYYKDNITEIIRLNELYQCKNGELSVNYFISSIDEKGIDALIYFNVFGLYSLCNKSDTDGYYSPGNSLDIICLLDLIKHYLINSEFYTSIIINNNSVYNLFNESLQKKFNVIIS
jgi:hypothetical protein